MAVPTRTAATTPTRQDRPHDLRGLIDRLAELDDLRTVHRPVDPDLELAAIIRRTCETRDRAPVFSRVLDCADGTRVLGAPGALSSLPGGPLARLAVALGLAPSATAQHIVGGLLAAYDRAPLPPITVPDAPFRANTLTGGDVDLGRLPQPMLHDGDGGRYFNSWGTIIVRTPDRSWTNWSITRLMTVGRTTMTGPLLPTQHVGMIYRMWAEAGEPMPFALVQGGDPAVPVVSGSPLPAHVDESGFVGAFLGEPVRLARYGEFDVPAGAEIVLEGHVSLTETAPEGPMGEYSGYISGAPRPQPLFHIESISHRDEPILPVVVAGEPVDETHTVGALGFAAEAMRLLRQAGLPVTFAWLPYASAAHWMVVTVPPDWPDLAHTDAPSLVAHIADVLFHSRVGAVIPKLFVLDDDIDPTDDGELTWAIATRVHPRDGHTVLEAEPVVPLVFCYRDEERQRRTGPKIAHNGLLPPGRAGVRRTAFRHNYPAEVCAAALVNLEERVTDAEARPVRR